MPFKSDAQRKFLYAKHPEIARRWSAEMKRKHMGQSDLPEKKEKVTFKKHTAEDFGTNGQTDQIKDGLKELAKRSLIARRK